MSSKLIVFFKGYAPQTGVGCLLPGMLRPNFGGEGGRPRAIRCALVSYTGLEAAGETAATSRVMRTEDLTNNIVDEGREKADLKERQNP